MPKKPEKDLVMPKKKRKGLIQINVGGVITLTEIDEYVQTIAEAEEEWKEIKERFKKKTKDEKLVEKQKEVTKRERVK